MLEEQTDAKGEDPGLPLFVDGYPSPNDIFGHQGYPGVDYLITTVNRLGFWRRKGWSQVRARRDTFSIQTKKTGDETIDCVVLCKGEPCGQVGTALAPFFIDRELDTLTGLGTPKLTTKETK